MRKPLKLTTKLILGIMAMVTIGLIVSFVVINTIVRQELYVNAITYVEQSSLTYVKETDFMYHDLEGAEHIEAVGARLDIHGGEHDGYMFLVDTNGVILHHPQHSRLNITTGVTNINQVDVYSEAFSRSRASAATFRSTTREEFYLMRLPMVAAGWTVVSIVPTSAIAGPVQSTLYVVFATIIGLIVLLTAFVMLFIPILMKQTVAQINERVLFFKTHAAEIAKTGSSNHESRDDLEFINSKTFVDTSFGLNKITEEFDASMLTVIDIVTDISTLHYEQLQGNYKHLLDEKKYEGAYAEIVFQINDLIKDFVSGRAEILDCIEKIVDGDFHAEIRQFIGDEAFINDAIENLRKNLNLIFEAVKDVANHSSSGNLDFKLDVGSYKGEWKHLIEELNGALQSINAPLVHISKIMDNMREGDFSHSVEEKNEYKGDFFNIITLLEGTTSDIASYISEISTVCSEMAAGNLQAKIERKYVGSFDLIKRSLNAILHRMNETMEDVSQVSNGVSGGADQLSMSAAALANGIADQMLSLKKLADGLTEVDDQSKKNATGAQKASDLAALSKENAEMGNEDMRELLLSMERISTSSDKISQIIKTIDSIAFQTNLLALNAAVEAACAGEHGRGFAVVAEEVRQLANRSSDAAKQTNILIQESIDRVNEGVEKASATAGSLGKIVTNVADVSSVIGEIYTSSVEQTESLTGISTELLHVNNMIHGDAAVSEQTAAAAAELDTQVEILREKLSFFKLRISSAPSMQKVWESAASGLEGISMVSDLKDAQGIRKPYTEGDIIIQEGDTGSESMFVLMEGSVSVYRAHGKINELKLATLRPGDIFGEMALFLNEPRSATVIAHKDAVVIEIHQCNMPKFIKDNPEFAYKISETLASRLGKVLSELGA